MWQQLKNFVFPKGFRERLSKEQRWDVSFTWKAIDEYLKFIFLCKFADHKVTPSKVVDEVWHLHLIYSDSYWNDLCKTILKRDIHHTPGNGNDDSIFEGQYKNTLNTYARTFGEPDVKYWPKPAEKVKSESWFNRLFSSNTTKSSIGATKDKDSGGGFWSDFGSGLADFFSDWGGGD